MDDRHYIAKLERMLEERKDIINTLITICGDLVEENDELTKQLDECETDYENMRDYADKCHADNVHTHELLERQSKDFDELYAGYIGLKDGYEETCESFDNLMEDYHCLDQRFCTEVRDHQEAQHKIKRLEGMVERRDKKIKDLTVERDVIKDACEDCSCVNELLAENEELKEKVDVLVDENKHLREEVKYLNAIVDGAS